MHVTEKCSQVARRTITRHDTTEVEQQGHVVITARHAGVVLGEKGDGPQMQCQMVVL